MEIELEDLSSSDIIDLIEQHHVDMNKHSPPESIHALKILELKHSSITFWSARVAGELAGCGAIKELDDKSGELKSMRTSSKYLRKGVAKALLINIIETAKNRGYSKLNLETGSMNAFLPARRLYEEFGFTYCSPFSDYKEDPNSVFMVKSL